MLEVFTHTFPATKTRPAYTCRAVMVHGREVPLCTYEGRECYVTGSFGAVTATVHYLDGTTAPVGMTRFRETAVTPWPKPNVDF